MPYLCGLWRFANAYRIILLRGVGRNCLAALAGCWEWNFWWELCRLSDFLVVRH